MRMKKSPDTKSFKYVVRRRDTRKEIVRVFDFEIGDVLVLLLHLGRNFPVEVECSGEPKDIGRSPGYLWVPTSEKVKLDDGIRNDPMITWRFVCYDLFNGVESAFYRNEKLRMIDLALVKKEYFAVSQMH